jgi:uncharacterized protein YciI
MFVILIRYISPLSKIDEVLEEHRAFLKKYYDKGKFIVSGPMDPRNGGIIIANTACRDEIQKIMEEDPFSREKVAEHVLIKFNPTLYSETFRA